jgi:sigma-B regulation protein RsbU (phosphoserine phosphatase)
MAPAMVVAQARSLVRVLAAGNVSPADVLNRVNSRLAADLQPHRFVTAVLAYLGSDGEIELASAGHAPILVAPSADAPMQELSATGLPLVVDPEPSVEMLPPIRLERGGQLVLLSDGIFEALSRGGELLGIGRVQAALRSQSDSPSQRQIEHLRTMVRTWSGGDALTDDQTIVIARRVLEDESLTLTTAGGRSL